MFEIEELYGAVQQQPTLHMMLKIDFTFSGVRCQRFPAAFRAHIRLFRFAWGTTLIEIAVYRLAR